MPQPKPLLSIIVVSFNTREMTLAALTSIAAETRTPHEVIIVDNASTDGSPGAIAAHPSRPRLVALEENIGFGRANNLGASLATGELLLLLNPDTVILDGAIDKLVAFSKSRPEAQIWGGRTVFADGRLNPASGSGRMTAWSLFCRASGLAVLFPRSGLFNSEAYGAWSRASEREVDIVSGCFFMLPRALWNRLGGFDPVYFMYGEETDLCLRARRLGARPRTTPDATIIHHGGASEVARAGKLVKLLAARATLIRRHWRSPLIPLGLILQAAWPLSRLVAESVRAMLGRASSAEAARAWAEVLRQWRSWLTGYPESRLPRPIAREAQPASPH